jgi:hypothetical protein
MDLAVAKEDHSTLGGPAVVKTRFPDYLLASASLLAATVAFLAAPLPITTNPAPQTTRQLASPNAAKSSRNQPAQTQTPRYVTAFVVDDRLSALRKEPNLKGVVARRLRLGRKVWIIAERAATRDQPRFCRVAVTRRTSGWIDALALSVPGRAGADKRLLDLINRFDDGFDRITRCELFLRNFPRSPLLPRVLLALGEEADRAAAALTGRSSRRAAKSDGNPSDVDERVLSLSDPRLDRYSRAGVSFDYYAGEYVYDGKAYREIVARHPASAVAGTARQRLREIQEKLGKHP